MDKITEPSGPWVKVELPASAAEIMECYQLSLRPLVFQRTLRHAS